MTSRRILDLITRKLMAELASDRLELARTNRRMNEAEATVGRLGALLADRRALPAAALAADLRLSCRVTGEIIAARDRQASVVAQLQSDLISRQEGVARKDRRRERLAEAAHAAALVETDAQDARTAAALPPRARPKS